MEAGKDNNGIFIAAYSRSDEREWRRTVGLAPGQGRGEISGPGAGEILSKIEGWILIARRRRKGLRKAEDDDDDGVLMLATGACCPEGRMGPQWNGMGVSFGGSSRRRWVRVRVRVRVRVNLSVRLTPSQPHTRHSPFFTSSGGRFVLHARLVFFFFFIFIFICHASFRSRLSGE